LDDVRYLLPLAARLQEQLARLGRLDWLAEELAALEDPGALTIEPDNAWLRIKGLRDLDPARARLARTLAAWRERCAVEHDRPRGAARLAPRDARGAAARRALMSPDQRCRGLVSRQV